MALKKRQINMIKKRLLHLPKGAGLFRYASNNIKFMKAVKKKSLVLPYPNSLMLELTNHCQLRCITCAREYAYGKEMEKGNMPIAQARKVIDETHVYLDRLGLTGLGEPLIYPDLKEIVSYIRERNKGISIFLSTNAELPNALELLEPIANDIDTLQISIDGADETFEEIRLRSKFSLFIENLEKIVELSKGKRFDPKLNMVVFDKNYKQMKKVILIAKKFGIKEIFFNSMNLVANDWPLNHYDFYNSPDFKLELDYLIQLAAHNNIYIEYPKFRENVSFASCPYMWNNFYITWDGYLVPCCAKPFPKEENFGNVFGSGLLDCINDKKMQSFRQMSIDDKAPDFCNRCHYLHGTA